MMVQHADLQRVESLHGRIGIDDCNSALLREGSAGGGGKRPWLSAHQTMHPDGAALKQRSPALLILDQSMPAAEND